MTAIVGQAERNYNWLKFFSGSEKKGKDQDRFVFQANTLMDHPIC